MAGGEQRVRRGGTEAGHTNGEGPSERFHEPGQDEFVWPFVAGHTGSGASGDEAGGRWPYEVKGACTSIGPYGTTQNFK